jgi:hypothetical protein
MGAEANRMLIPTARVEGVDFAEAKAAVTVTFPKLATASGSTISATN